MPSPFPVMHSSSILRTGILFLLCAVFQHTALAQAPASQNRLSQLENAKIAYITDKISLTQEQAQRFWPIYNDFSDKRRNLNRRMRELRADNPDALSDQQIKENLNQSLALRQQEVDAEKDYLNKVQKVLSLRQVAKLYVAERQFTREVLQRVAGGHRGGGRSVNASND